MVTSIISRSKWNQFQVNVTHRNCHRNKTNMKKKRRTEKRLQKMFAFTSFETLFNFDDSAWRFLWLDFRWRNERRRKINVYCLKCFRFLCLTRSRNFEVVWYLGHRIERYASNTFHSITQRWNKTCKPLLRPPTPPYHSGRFWYLHSSVVCRSSFIILPEEKGDKWWRVGHMIPYNCTKLIFNFAPLRSSSETLHLSIYSSIHPTVHPFSHLCVHACDDLKCLSTLTICVVKWDLQTIFLF